MLRCSYFLIILKYHYDNNIIMNSRALGRTSIPLVAIVMIGVMMVVSVIPVAFAQLPPPEGNCPPGVGFVPTFISSITDATLQAKANKIDAADGVTDGLVCVKTFTDKGKAGKTHTVIIDNNFPF